MLRVLKPAPRVCAQRIFTRPNTTAVSSSSDGRVTASFYISNVFPIRLAYWDFRPTWAALREGHLMERLKDIGDEIKDHSFRIESWEIARKDGGVFMHFSYIPPAAAPISSEEEANTAATTPEVIINPNSPGNLFLPALTKAAELHGGFPSWLGQWTATKRFTGAVLGQKFPGREIIEVQGSKGSPGVRWMAGGGRVWVVKGRQWTEDMNRFPSSRLRVEFDGPDVSQEIIYTLFRPYGRLTDITPPSPVPAGSLRFASVSYSSISPATKAINCLHGFSTPTNTADFALRTRGQTQTIPLSRLRLFYERPLKAHAIRDWMSAHPRLVLPIIAFLIGTLSYTFFDPIRAFFVRTQVEGVWDLEKYSFIQSIRSKFSSTISFFQSSSSASKPEETIGEGAWKDRQEAERDVKKWLSEYPGTFITITGPPGSGKVSLVTRVLNAQSKPAMVIDCAEIAKAKNDAQLVDALASQTGYWPVFSFLSSLNGLIDLAAVGLIGQKAGFSTPIDQQLRSILEVVGGALKDVSTHARAHHAKEKAYEKQQIELKAEQAHRREMIARGGWHDGRLDCIAGNGIMSELGLGDERANENELLPVVPLIDDTAPIKGEAVPPSPSQIPAIVEKIKPIDEESETIKTLPIVVLKNFAQKSAKGDLWTVLSEWAAGLIENKVAHVIIVTEGAMATKSLTKALPSKPFNNVSLADADTLNSLSYVRDKLAAVSDTYKDPISAEDSSQIAKLGGRMVDLETLVYKVRTGSTIPDAVEDIVSRTVVELRKLAFGDDAEDAKNLPWTRAQAWKIVSELAKGKEVSYAKLLQEFPFKGAEQSLKALEEHDLISISSYEGRASKVKPGKPVFTYAFAAMVKDPIFKSTSQIEYNNAVIAKVESEIRGCEEELQKLKEISANGGGEALGVEGGFLGLGKSSAIKDRAKWLLDKMGKNVEKLNYLERDNAEMVKVLSTGHK